MFQVFAATPEDMGPGEIGAHAARAEAMGYDGLQVPDAIHDGLLLSAMALNATQRLIVGTGVLVAFPRSPMTVAIASWDLQMVPLMLPLLFTRVLRGILMPSARYISLCFIAPSLIPNTNAPKAQ